MRLSNVLSEATEQALKDLDLVKNDSNYVINFKDWHVSNKSVGQFKNTKCSVCFSGSVMAKSLNANINIEYEPEHFPEADMLRALDFIREGFIINALSKLNIELPENCNSNMSVDQSNYKNFVRDIKLIVKHLKSFGL